MRPAIGNPRTKYDRRTRSPVIRDFSRGVRPFLPGRFSRENGLKTARHSNVLSDQSAKNNRTINGRGRIVSRAKPLETSSVGRAHGIPFTGSARPGAPCSRAHAPSGRKDARAVFAFDRRPSYFDDRRAPLSVHRDTQ